MGKEPLWSGCSTENLQKENLEKDRGNQWGFGLSAPCQNMERRRGEASQSPFQPEEKKKGRKGGVSSTSGTEGYPKGGSGREIWLSLRGLKRGDWGGGLTLSYSSKRVSPMGGYREDGGYPHR